MFAQKKIIFSINYLIALSKQEIKPTQISYSSKDLELKKELAEKYYYEDEFKRLSFKGNNLETLGFWTIIFMGFLFVFILVVIK